MGKSGSCLLKQNYPNPFSESMRINYYLPDDIQKATIYIYDMNGKQLKSIPLNQKGNGSITIKGSELKAGMYMYALITDGQIIDTKRMILMD
jgi:flagellar hook assembly protein FlgD